MVSTVLASAYSFNIITSTQDSVIFEYSCGSNAACMKPGEEYCGEGEVKSVLCINERICQVECRPIKTKSVKEDWPSTFTVMPKDKRVGEPFVLSVTDTRNGKPIVCDVEIYYGGRMESEQLRGATHWGGSITVVTDFVSSTYRDGVLIESTHTDRQGILTYTPEKPGRYALRLLNRYVTFIVGDESGKFFECGDGICDTSLGEDEGTCPEDCEESPEEKVVCGDGVCGEGENRTVCPEDCPNLGLIPECVAEGQSITTYPVALGCCEGLEQIGCEVPQDDGRCPDEPCNGSPVCARCGNNECGKGENYCNCPQDCTPPWRVQTTQTGDNTLPIIAIIVITIALVVIVTMIIILRGEKSKEVPSKKSAGEKRAEGVSVCPKCGAAVEPDYMFCARCGYRM